LPIQYSEQTAKFKQTFHSPGLMEHEFILKMFKASVINP
jgi:hypothetical protein